MWSRSSRGLLAAAVAGVVISPGAGAKEIKVTEERAKICAKAATRYKKLYPDATAEPGTVVVTLYKYNFCPANITVKSGTTVRWVNVDRRTSHSVWMKDAGVAESERFFPEEQWDFTFVTPGEYPYLCGPHGKQEGMRGYVKVTK